MVHVSSGQGTQLFVGNERVGSDITSSEFPRHVINLGPLNLRWVMGPYNN